MDKDKIDWNAPAFGDKAQKVDGTVVPPAAEVVVPPAIVDPVSTPDPVVVEVENKVPYSRFKKFHDAAKEAQADADYWKAEAERRSSYQPPSPQPIVTDDLPAAWVKLYGNEEASKEAWQVQKALQADMLAQARKEALEAVENQQTQESQRVDENLEALDSNFEDLSALVGRDLTDAEQSAVLDIIDEFTPKDQRGNYAGEILPFEKAWEIYELKTQAGKAPRTQSRDAVAALSGQGKSSDAGAQAEQDKAFNPFDWNAWKKKI